MRGRVDGKRRCRARRGCGLRPLAENVEEGQHRHERDEGENRAAGVRLPAATLEVPMPIEDECLRRVRHVFAFEIWERYGGPDETYRDESGAVLPRGIPVAVSDAAARRLGRDPRIVVTAATYQARGGGCC